MSKITHAACLFGARRQDDGRIDFRLWAPAQQSVSVALESGETLAMTRTLDGWFQATAALPAGTRYRYRLADGLLVPDPASTEQAPDVHDPSIIPGGSYVRAAFAGSAMTCRG